MFKHAVAMITDVIEDAFRATGKTAADIDWLVPHQANNRIIDDSAQKLEIARDKLVMTVDSTATPRPPPSRWRSTPSSAMGKVKKGDPLMLEGIGGGFTWGSALVRW